MYVDAISPVGLGSTSVVNSLFPSSSASDIFNIINPPPNANVVDTRPWWAQSSELSVFDKLLMFASYTYQQSTKEERIFAASTIQMYIQYPNEQLERLAEKITEGLSDNDDKATAIIRWVLYNLPYQTDEKNYGTPELWVPPTFSLQKGSGDCEDGAFLVHSLLLHAGIPMDRVRTYGGEVRAGEGAATGGHAWTAYKRESDDEWVILDSSYYPTLKHVKDRPLMKNMGLYVDNYFYFDQLYWTNLDGIDRIHNPGAIYTYSPQGMLEQQMKYAGVLLNAFA